MKKEPLLAVSPDDVVDAVRSFPSAVNESQELQTRLSNARAWYAIQDGRDRWIFAPSKWAGYIGLTAAQYLANARENMNGRKTEERLQQWFEPLPPQSPQHIELLKKLGAFTSQYGKQPSSACRISIIRAEEGGNSDEDDLVELIVRVIKRLDARQRMKIQRELRD